MLCECGQREATIHEVVIKNGKKVEKHLCEACASKHGIDPKAGVPISQLISSFVLSSEGLRATPAEVLVCSTCGTTYDSFKQSGLLGCPDCYDAFGDDLSHLLERSHEGATHHLGKRPKRAGRGAGDDQALQTLKRLEQVKKLRRKLDAALASEQYEQAASLRDQIRTLSHPEDQGEGES